MTSNVSQVSDLKQRLDSAKNELFAVRRQERLLERQVESLTEQLQSVCTHSEVKFVYGTCLYDKSEYFCCTCRKVIDFETARTKRCVARN